MINDKAPFRSPHSESPERSNISEFDDDVLSKMMEMGDSPKHNLFEEHRNGLQEKQDVDVDNFFSETSVNAEENTVDITALPQVLNKRSR